MVTVVLALRVDLHSLDRHLLLLEDFLVAVLEKSEWVRRTSSASGISAVASQIGKGFLHFFWLCKEERSAKSFTFMLSFAFSLALPLRAALFAFALGFGTRLLLG